MKSLGIQKDWLYREYIEQEKSINRIARDLSCSYTVIWRWLHKYNIPTRKQGYNWGWAKGQILTEEHKRKISAAQKGKKGYWYGKRGVNTAHYKDGRTEENHSVRTSLEYKEWQLEVFKRDYYACVRCLNNPGVLHAHHIIPFILAPEERFELSNGATLCPECHKWIHSHEL